MINNPVRPLSGILLLFLSTWALSALDTSGKWVMGTGVSLFLLCWMRYVVHFILAMLLILPAKGRRVLRTRNIRNQLLRGFLMLASTMSMFTTLSYLPQAIATSINFLAPLLVLALAPWILDEPARKSRWVAALAGFAGVLIVIRPGAGLDAVGTIFGLITACLFTGQFLANRLVAVDDTYTTLLWSGAVGSIILTAAVPFMLPSIVPIMASLGPLQWLILLSTGFWGGLGHLLQIHAYRNAPASMLSPFLYLQIVAASVLGWMVWGDFPDGLSWFGIFIIAASGILISVYEWRQRAQTDKAAI